MAITCFRPSKANSDTSSSSCRQALGTILRSWLLSHLCCLHQSPPISFSTLPHPCTPTDRLSEKHRTKSDPAIPTPKAHTVAALAEYPLRFTSTKTVKAKLVGVRQSCSPAASVKTGGCPPEPGGQWWSAAARRSWPLPL